MKEQKFKRGNLVRVITGFPVWDSSEGVVDMEPENVGMLAIINYSYAEKYGGSDTDSYSIIWLDNGSSLAWKNEGELELVDEGGEHLFGEAALNREKVSRQATDIGYIAKNLEEGNLSSQSVLYLFNLIGYKSKSLSNGEFFTLWDEWWSLHPYFVHIRNSDTLEEAKSVFSKRGLENLDIERVWNAFHPDASL